MRAAARALPPAGAARAGGLHSRRARGLRMPAPTLSFHLKTLVAAELVASRRAGRHLYYRPNFTRMTTLIEFLTAKCCTLGAPDREESCGPTCMPSKRGDVPLRPLSEPLGGAVHGSRHARRTVRARGVPAHRGTRARRGQFIPVAPLSGVTTASRKSPRCDSAGQRCGGSSGALIEAEMRMPNRLCCCNRAAYRGGECEILPDL